MKARRMKTALHRLLLLPLLATPAWAQEARPLEGRYALHREACAANDIFLTLRGDRMDLPVFSCTGLSVTPRKAAGGDRAVWDVTGTRCEGEEGQPGPQRFALEARGTALRILWPNGDKSAPLLRCGK